MKQCECGQSISLLSFYPVCEACLSDYLVELRHKTGFSITQFQFERQRARQSAAASAHVTAYPQRVRLLNTGLDPVTLAEAMATIESYVDMGLPRQIVTVNVDFIKIAQENNQFHRIVNNSDLSLADGKPLLWAARWKGQYLPARITGMDVVLGSAELAVRRNESMFLLGAAEGIAAKAAEVLQAGYPGLRVHSYSPPFGPFSADENVRMVEMIRDSGAKYLFVAFGAPKQDIWIHENLQDLGVPVCAGIGGVLNFLAGAVKRAPQWVQHCGMEWVYRITQEPRRLWRRYILQDLPVFVSMLREPAETSVTSMPQPMYRLLPANATSILYERGVSSVQNVERAVGG